MIMKSKIKNSHQIAWHLKTRPIGRPAPSATNYQSTPHKIPQEADLNYIAVEATNLAKNAVFPFRLSRYICVEISHKQISHIFPFLLWFSATPHLLFIHHDSATSTGQSTYVFIVRLNPDIATAVM